MQFRTLKSQKNIIDKCHSSITFVERVTLVEKGATNLLHVTIDH